jgi:hypothetical protein
MAVAMVHCHLARVSGDLYGGVVSSAVLGAMGWY